MENQPLSYIYSIIIPHYRIPHLLMRCLDSIPKRDDIQIIIVDDNSPDGEGYLKEYEELHRENLSFVRAPENGGIGYARNLGLPYAKGEWLVFCDADDTFGPGAFDIMDSFAGADAEIVYFRPKVVVDGDWAPESDHKWLGELYDNYQRCRDDRIIRSYHVVAWSKMLKREWIMEQGLTFEETRFSEDVMFSIRSGIQAKHVIVSDDSIYDYHLRQGSSSNIINSSILYERARIGMRANMLLEEKYSLHYLDAYDAMLDLRSVDRKAFWSLVRAFPSHRMSILRLLRKMFQRHKGDKT